MQRFQGTSNYVATDDLKVAVNAAVLLRRPLLVKGEPGTGKTVLAHEIALALGAPLIEWNVKSTTKAQQGLYEYDAVARLRDDLGKIGIERVEGNVEPEDHAATLCEIMAGVIGGQFDAHPGSDQEIFEKHMAPWMGRFFRDIEAAEAAKFYRPVGTIGRLLMDIETEAFALNV